MEANVFVVVTPGEYVYAVFSTEEKAKAYVKKRDGFRWVIKTYVMDKQYESYIDEEDTT